MVKIWEAYFIKSAKELGYFAGGKDKRKMRVVFRYLKCLVSKEGFLQLEKEEGHPPAAQVVSSVSDPTGGRYAR